MPLQRKYSVDDNYFDNIESADKYYLLGFIAADAYLPKEMPLLTFGLSIKDKNQLYLIQKLLNTTYPVSEYTVYNKQTNKDYLCCKLSIRSTRIINKLNQLGFDNQKSSSLTWPTWIKSKFVWHFIRGYFDGDGGIHLSQKTINTKQLQLNFIGTKSFLQGMRKFLLDNFNIEYGTDYKGTRKTFHRMAFWGNKKAAFIAYNLYKNSTKNNRLLRKYLIYQDFLQYYQNLIEKGVVDA